MYVILQIFVISWNFHALAGVQCQSHGNTIIISRKCGKFLED
jgi:hypothetical protein